MAVVLGSGEHVHELVSEHAAERPAEKQIALFEIAAVEAGAHEGAHPVAGDFAERLNPAVGFIGGGKRSQLVIERRRRQLAGSIEAHDDQIGERNVLGFLAGFPIQMHSGVLEDPLGLLLHGRVRLRGMRTLEVENDGEVGGLYAAGEHSGQRGEQQSGQSSNPGTAHISHLGERRPGTHQDTGYSIYNLSAVWGKGELGHLKCH